MADHEIVPPAGQQRTAGSAPAHLLGVTDDGGWTLQRLEVISDAAGVCARCGTTGADTVLHSWFDDRLVAVHTRCVVGLGPPVGPGRDRAA
jgi:hypothetical protein